MEGNPEIRLRLQKIKEDRERKQRLKTAVLASSHKANLLLENLFSSAKDEVIGQTRQCFTVLMDLQEKLLEDIDAEAEKQTAIIHKVKRHLITVSKRLDELKEDGIRTSLDRIEEQLQFLQRCLDVKFDLWFCDHVKHLANCSCKGMFDFRCNAWSDGEDFAESRPASSTQLRTKEKQRLVSAVSRATSGYCEVRMLHDDIDENSETTGYRDITFGIPARSTSGMTSDSGYVREHTVRKTIDHHSDSVSTSGAASYSGYASVNERRERKAEEKLLPSRKQFILPEDDQNIILEKLKRRVQLPHPENLGVIQESEDETANYNRDQAVIQEFNQLPKHPLKLSLVAQRAPGFHELFSEAQTGSLFETPRFESVHASIQKQAYIEGAYDTNIPGQTGTNQDRGEGSQKEPSLLGKSGKLRIVREATTTTSTFEFPSVKNKKNLIRHLDDTDQIENESMKQVSFSDENVKVETSETISELNISKKRVPTAKRNRTLTWVQEAREHNEKKHDYVFAVGNISPVPAYHNDNARTTAVDGGQTKQGRSLDPGVADKAVRHPTFDRRNTNGNSSSTQRHVQKRPRRQKIKPQLIQNLKGQERDSLPTMVQQTKQGTTHGPSSSLQKTKETERSAHPTGQKACGPEATAHVPLQMKLELESHSYPIRQKLAETEPSKFAIQDNTQELASYQTESESTRNSGQNSMHVERESLPVQAVVQHQPHAPQKMTHDMENYPPTPVQTARDRENYLPTVGQVLTEHEHSPTTNGHIARENESYPPAGQTIEERSSLEPTSQLKVSEAKNRTTRTRGAKQKSGKRPEKIKETIPTPPQSVRKKTRKQNSDTKRTVHVVDEELKLNLEPDTEENQTKLLTKRLNLQKPEYKHRTGQEFHAIQTEIRIKKDKSYSKGGKINLTSASVPNLPVSTGGKIAAANEDAKHIFQTFLKQRLQSLAHRS